MIVRIKYIVNVEKSDKSVRGVTQIVEYPTNIYLRGLDVAPRDQKHRRSEIIDMFVEMEESK